MTSHISELQDNIVIRISAGGSLRKEQTIHPLARSVFNYGPDSTRLGMGAEVGSAPTFP